MHRLKIVALFVLVACSPPPSPVTAPQLRDPKAPIYSSAILDLPKLDGAWTQVATVAGMGCGAGAVDFAEGGVTWDLCLPQGASQGQGRVTAGKPGRFGVEGMQDWWVLWVDADYRTMVIGTPSGEFGFVLNRSASIPADRVKAARDLLKFNGYDPEQIQVF